MRIPKHARLSCRFGRWFSKDVNILTQRTRRHNGLGDRLTQNGIQYALDLNAGLTQVLDDGANTYTYGLGRISQTDNSTEYFIGDALGSVRQLANANAEITLAKSYAPYGEVMSTEGSGTSPFAFTGEQQDASGLTYLRARYYNPYLNQFIQPDTIVPDPRTPAELNRYAYVRNNPINYVDPTGHYWWGSGQALFDASDMKARSQNIHVRIQALAMVNRGAKRIHAEFPGPSAFIPVPNIDLLDSITGEIWEIKPWGDQATAVLDMSTRVLSMNGASEQEQLIGRDPMGMPFNWNYSPLNWIPGLSFPTNVYIGRDLTGWYDFYAGQTSPGVIAWWKVKRLKKLPVPNPILLPDPVTFNQRNQRSSEYQWGGNLIPQRATQFLTGVTIVGVCVYIAKEVAEFYFCGPCSFVLP